MKRPQRRAQVKVAAMEQMEDSSADTTESGRPGILDDYLTTEELAAELSVIPLTIVRWRLQNRGPPITRLGRRILYRRLSVAQWLAAQEKQFR